MTVQVALVVPADCCRRTRRVLFAADHPPLLDVLRREIRPGAAGLDASPRIPTVGGPIMYWTADDALLRDTVDHNDRVLALVRALGHLTPDVGGTIVLTGDITADGDCLGLPEQLCAELEALLAAEPATAPVHQPAELDILVGPDAWAYLRDNHG